MREEDVTLAVEIFLRENNWEILALNNPFSGKAVWIKPSGGFRSKGTLIPDLIAKKDEDYLILESYDKLKIRDIAKLEKYSRPEYLETIKDIFHDQNIKILKAMAYPEPVREYNYPKDFIIFGINKDLSINVYKDKDKFLLEGEKIKTSSKDIFR